MTYETARHDPASNPPDVPAPDPAVAVSVEAPQRHLTRRQALTGAAGAAGLAVAGGGALGISAVIGGGQPAATIPGFSTRRGSAIRSFVSRPDLRPPAVAVSGSRRVPGLLFIAPTASQGSQSGPLIVGDFGEPVWFNPRTNAWAANVRTAEFRGETVLTWWEGTRLRTGYGQGEGVIADRSYREVARVRAGNGRQMDLHEFQLTPEGTALITCYPSTKPVDLSALGGARDASTYESIIQEVDVQTGRVLLEWRSLEHVPISESYHPPSSNYDYMHANSIEVTADGNLLVSARHTWALYKLDRRSGALISRLGGKRSDFTMAPGSQFSWQHDARTLSDGTITVFDDGSDGYTNTESQSRGLVLAVDDTARTVRVARAYRHPQKLLTQAMGNVQTLPDGHVIVGWGTSAHVSEFTADGELVSDARLPSTYYSSYRGFRLPWRALAPGVPTLGSRRNPRTGRSTVYVSWNGATDVSHWRVDAGARPSDLRPRGLARREGFETAIPLGTAEGYVSIMALSASGRELAASAALKL
jgi:hypothetical protein